MKLTPFRDMPPNVEFRIKVIDGELYAATEETKNMSFWYVASPYSKYPKGLDEACAEVCRSAALLVKADYPIFCPIAHSHPIATMGGLPDDYKFWEKQDKVMMGIAKGLIVVTMHGWINSHGVLDEIKTFTDARKPIIFMAPGVVPYVLIDNAA